MNDRIEASGGLSRAWKFLRNPRREKFGSLFARWTRLFPGIPLPIRLPFGAWFLARSDYVGAALVYEGFERNEQTFLQRFLESSMTVLDVGAHQGVYTLLASKMVGSEGRVVSFEPSPREQNALQRNVRLNRCQNVRIEKVALGNQEAQAELYVTPEGHSGCNSLRPPALDEATSQVTVRVRRLDRWIEDHRFQNVDFLKLDVEGGELSVLEGAEQLLTRVPRPIILAEVQDVRTAPWGYPAKAIIRHLRDRGYSWFSVLACGSLQSLDDRGEKYDGNFVACPKEKIQQLLQRFELAKR